MAVSLSVRWCLHVMKACEHPNHKPELLQTHPIVATELSQIKEQGKTNQNTGDSGQKETEVKRERRGQRGE